MSSIRQLNSSDPDFWQQLDEVLAAVASVVGMAAAGAKEAVLSAEDFSHLATELRAKLEAYDADADGVLEKITRHELAADQLSAFTRLKEKLDDYDFDSALAILNEAVSGKDG